MMLLPYRNNGKSAVGELIPIYESESEEDLIKYMLDKSSSLGKELMSYKSYISSLLVDIGMILPPIKLSSLANRGNVLDSSFLSGVREWINYTFESHTLMDIDKEKCSQDWRLIPIEKYDYSNVDIEGITYWCINSKEGTPYEYYDLLILLRSFSIDEYDVINIKESPLGLFKDEYQANEKVLELNTREAEPSLAYPFAWNTYWTVPSYIPIDLVQSAGFTVYESYEDNETYMGVDGCGYDFYTHHWIPLYSKYCERNKILIDTSSGPRYITTNED